jgi:dTDP-4-dehydrorhamnose 3,5-epimerase-like enzyme
MEEVRIIELPKFEDSRGNLSFIEQHDHIPFDIKRTYWIYDVPGGMIRGGHAFIEQQEFIVALSGSLDIYVTNGEIEQIFSLNRSYYGLFIPQGYWRRMQNFSTNSLAMVLSSTKYAESDYIRSFAEYKKYKGI